MYELRHLQALAAVADEGTFGRAASRLGYTQSTLSQQVALLEKQVKGSLFERPGGPKPVRITPLGEVVLAHAREILVQASRLDDVIERFRMGDGRLDIGTFQTVTNVLLPSVISRLKAAHPACEIRLSEDESPAPELGDLDLLFFDSPLPGSRQVLEDEHLLLAPKGTFTAGRRSLEELHDRDIVALPPICDQGRVEAVLREKGIEPNVVFRTSDNQAVVAMVRAGLGCAVMPRLSVDVDDQVDAHALSGLPKRAIYLQTRASLSPLGEHAARLVCEVAETL